ncbi:bacteriocin-protection, YdeI or OmpD-associated-domain-containing protein [Thermothelomyces heterothallicus CBS 202.75]|uniref:bacteriocin-protection, YdeI or OmpD-associated-domain-containing protein n=1 Tax=Thermothelomyces heterothallicus CBS 202.75 TaxID=1149848 RepID=UPI00374293B9
MTARTRLATRTVQTARPAPVSTTAAKPVPKATKSATTTVPQPIRLFEDVKAWETWLEANHTDQAGLWLKIAKKGGKIASITYEEALETALCFGWIDGQKKSLDADHFIQRFTPRRKGSLWSRRNVEKVEALIAAGRMREPGWAEVEAGKADGRWEKAYAPASAMQVPDDFREALERNSKAKAFFEGLGKTKRYSFLWRITTAKREETRRKKIDQFITLLARGETL